MLTHPAGFRQRRALNWLLAGAMYAFFYMARYNFAAVSALLAELFGWSNTRLGVISAVGTTVYGVSVFFNGPLADKIGGRGGILLGGGGAGGFHPLFGPLPPSVAPPPGVAGGGAGAPRGCVCATRH